MLRFFGFLILLALLGALGLIGYSYSGYLTPNQRIVTEPVILNVD